MNRMLLTGMVAMLIFVSCNDKKTATTTPVPDTQVKAAAQVDPLVQKLETLQKAEPTDMDAMQKKLPEELAGIKRSKMSMNSNLGYNVVEADYAKSSKNYVHIVMYDCTGEKGADLYKNSFQSYLNKSDATEAGYTKTIDFKGDKAIERFDAANKIATLSFMSGDKVLVVLSGKDVPVETLKEEAQKL